MDIAKLYVHENSIDVELLHPVTSGTVGARVDIEYDGCWSGMDRTIIWRGSGRSIVDIMASGVVPAEVVAAPGSRLMVGFYGTVDGTATPTIWADLGTVLTGADPSGDPSTEPSLPVWAQIKDIATKAEDSAEQANGVAEAAKTAADEATAKAKGAVEFAENSAKEQAEALTEYVTKDYYYDHGRPGLVTIAMGGEGGLKPINQAQLPGGISIAAATSTNIDERASNYKPIVPKNLDYAVKSAIVGNSNQLSDKEKKSAQNWLGVVPSDDASVATDSVWSSKNTVDKLCPSFTESGSIVSCEPVEGYPLSVQADDAAKVYRCGKNLLKPLPGTYTYNGVTIDVYEDGTFVVNGTATATAAIDVAERVRIMEGATYTLSGCTGGSYKTYQLCANSNVLELYNSSVPYTGAATGTGLTKVRFYAYAGYSFSNMVIKPQLEVGSTATERELYRGTEEFAPGEAIPALAGVNTIWADSGEVTVTGKADPVAVSRKQDERIKALEATMTALLEG